MKPAAAGSITQFFERLRNGDRTAAGPLCERFLPRLIALARHTLAGRPQRVAGAEDAVQAALVDFWQQAERGELVGEMRRENLWNLLGLMTVRKAMQQVRKETAQKRGGGKVMSLAGGEDSAAHHRLAQSLAVLPTHEFDLHCEELLLQLSDDLRLFALLRLMGHETADIARLLDCTQRKVQRKLELVRLRWEKELQDEDL
jgi:DNA-directed RNA polymerase specialized sigma24 family protein